MSVIEYISCCLLLISLSATAMAQVNSDQAPRVMLGEINIKGEIRQPSVSIISSRIQPEFRKLHVEKSFLTEIRQAPAEVIELNSDIRAPFKIHRVESMLLKDRQYQSIRRGNK